MTSKPTIPEFSANDSLEKMADSLADIAAKMLEEIRGLVGYPMHGSLGFYHPGLPATITD
jgi:hypothetical protein